METLCKTVIMVLFTFARGEDTQDLEDIKEMMRDMNTRLQKAEDQLATTKTELVIAKNALNELAKKDTELESEITRIRNPPYMHACGFKRNTIIKSATIPYSTLLYSSTNTEGGGLDIDTGLFTSPHPGSYTVTWGLSANEDTGEYVTIFLQHNGSDLDESYHHSSYEGSGLIRQEGILKY